MMARKLIRFIFILLRIAAIPLFFVLFIASLFYFTTTIYNFPEAKPFNGKYIYNPYETLPLRAFKAHFHAHSKEWKGITDGHNDEQDVFNAYTSRNYDIAGISNYHKISTYGADKTNLFVPMYEHGYNIFKSHYLSIKPDGVSYFDFPLLQSSSHQQMIINQLRKKNAFVAMAHPKFGGARKMKNMRDLVGYHFTEVLNHYRTSAEYYDEALSAGRLTWVMSNDDTHDLEKEPSFKRWNMIFSDTALVDTILNNYKLGKSYAVLSEDESFDKQFISCQSLGDDRFKVTFSAVLDSILVIGQGGKLKEFNTDAQNIVVTFQADDTYLRVVAKDENIQIYLNPLIRFDGIRLPLNADLTAEVNHFLTWLYRIAVFLVMLSLALIMRKLIIR
jgi:hypothetical protein